MMDTNMVAQLRTAKADAEHLRAELGAAEQERDGLRRQLAEAQQQLAAAQREGAQARQSNERMQTVLQEFAEVKRLVEGTQQAIIRELINEWSMVVGAPMKTTIKEVNELFKHQGQLRDDLHQTLAGFDDGVKTLKAQTAKHIKETTEYVTSFKAGMEHCDRAVQACTSAAETCAGFRTDYETAARTAGTNMSALAVTAGADMQTFSGQMQAGLKEYVEGLKTRAHDAMMPVVERVEYLTEAQFTWRLVFAAFGFVLCLATVVGTTYLLQGRLSAEILDDAASWRAFTRDLPAEQREKVTKLVDEIHGVQGGEQPPKQEAPAAAGTPGAAEQGAIKPPPVNGKAPARRAR